MRRDLPGGVGVEQVLLSDEATASRLILDGRTSALGIALKGVSLTLTWAEAVRLAAFVEGRL